MVVRASEVLELTCTGYGVPPPNLTWTKDDGAARCLQATPYRAQCNMMMMMDLLYSVLKLVFTVSNKGSLDSGHYRCSGVNGVPNLIGTPKEAVVMVTALGKTSY